MDGFGAAMKIIEYQKRNPTARKVPIVAVTAYEDVDTINRCHNIGMVDVIHKPISCDVLIKIV